MCTILQHSSSAVCISSYNLAAADCMLGAYDPQHVYRPQQVSQFHPCPGNNNNNTNYNAFQLMMS